MTMEFMDKCRHHPDRDACVVCQKMEVAYCQECLAAFTESGKDPAKVREEMKKLRR